MNKSVPEIRACLLFLYVDISIDTSVDIGVVSKQVFKPKVVEVYWVNVGVSF